MDIEAAVMDRILIVPVRVSSKFEQGDLLDKEAIMLLAGNAGVDVGSVLDAIALKQLEEEGLKVYLHQLSLRIKTKARRSSSIQNTICPRLL